MRKTSTRSVRNFWTKLNKPFFTLAPMANVTDAAFRQLIAKYGKPDVTWTEFVSADGLISPGRRNLLLDLKYSPKERPIVAQLFTSNPLVMAKAASLIKKLKFDGLDINMGCPDRAVEKQGAGAALMKHPKLAIEILEAAKKGAGSTLPVSIKTRIGYNSIDLNWIKLLLEQHLPALTVHLRTRKEMSDVPAHWDLMPEIIKMRNSISPETLIIGNGDVESVEQGLTLIRKYKCDGVMIGRGMFGRPWAFEKSGSRKQLEKSPAHRLKIMIEHARLFEKHFKGYKSFDIMKKHFKAYVSGWPGARELRATLMTAKNSKDVEEIIADVHDSQLST